MSDTDIREKHDRELIELLNELRVALPGAQTLFAFLLIAPFSSRFHVDERAERASYLVALFSAVASIVLLIAPSAYHRLRWRERDKERMLQAANRFAIAGMAAIAVSMTASVFLVSDVLLPRTASTLVTVAAGVCFAGAWFAFPLSTRYDRWDDEPSHTSRPSRP